MILLDLFIKMEEIKSLIKPFITDKSFDEIYKQYRYVYIYCRDYEKYDFVRCPLKIIRYSLFAKNMMTINKNKINDITLANNEFVLVLFLPFINKSSLDIFLKQHNNENSLITYLSSLSMNSILNVKNNAEFIQLSRINLLNTMYETFYWQLTQNCQMNITKQFLIRDFKKSDFKNIVDTNIKNIMNDITDNIDDYLTGILDAKNKYIDPSVSLEKKLSYYKIDEKIQINKDDITFLIVSTDIISIKEKYYLIMNLLASKKYCHLIVNNKKVLIYLKNSKFIELYYDVVEYLMRYVWIALYMEESIKKSYLCDEDRCIFDIDTAYHLPYLPSNSSFSDVETSAYLPLLISEKTKIHKSNLLPPKLIYSRSIHYGVCSIENFKCRLKYFTSGTSEYDIFKNLNWNNIALTGSTMACILPNFNPLMLKYMTRLTFDPIDSNFIKYADDRYKNSDIDIVCNLQGHDFIDKVFEIREQLEKNITEFIIGSQYDRRINLIDIDESDINEINTDEINVDETNVSTNIVISDDLTTSLNTNGDVADSKVDSDDECIEPARININKSTEKFIINAKENRVKIISNRTVFIFVNKMFIRRYLIDVNTESTENDIEHNIENVIIKLSEQKYVDKIYDIYKQDFYTDKNEYDIKYSHDHTIVDKKFAKIYFSKNEKMLSYSHSLKYKLVSKYLKRPLELFKCKYPNFFSIIGTFHFPIVRSYYNGETVKLTPSCFTACTTLMNMDYKYFAGIKDPITVITKYYLNGFGGFYNSKELGKFFAYHIKTNFFKEKFDIDFNNVSECNIMLKRKNYYDNIYGSFSGNRLDNNTNIKKIYYPDAVDMFKNIRKTIAINQDGFINKMNYSLITYAFEYVINESCYGFQYRYPFLRSNFRTHDSVEESDAQEPEENEQEEQNNIILPNDTTY